ncbi:MiaB/RimO family radical SAM methylthiotransferase [Patescibacteria group bacterium]|nr:MiaB/RimO family radical SAM methylthiotransferase [Patescibacteria group bacterium]MBU1921838.1 MiaB/RimO family radical SAM methylthiotransferase [Patescibacteria group bacterium]
MKISFYALGCRANQADNRKIQQELAKIGWQVVCFSEPADFCVVNICAVTSGAEQRSRQMLRAAKTNNAHVIASGCFIEKIPEIDLYFKSPKQTLNYLKKIHTSTPKPIPRTRTRSFIRIQDGCNFDCAYCLIKKIRGRSRSIPPHEIIRQINQEIALGRKEITLTGINIMQYAHPGFNLVKLLEKILDKTDIPRIRLGSVDPRLVTDNFINLFKNPRLRPDCGRDSDGQARLLPHIHLSLQSGSDRILRLMNRGHTTKQYLKIIEQARDLNPLFSFTTDVITGFPGETAADHEKTLGIIKKAQFTKVHIFPYSDRPGTASEKLGHKIPQKIKKQRLREIEQIAQAAKKNWLKNYQGKTLDVLFEQKTDRAWQGYTPYYFKVNQEDRNDLTNKIIQVKIGQKNFI